MSDDLRFVYITARSDVQARVIGDALVETRLAACVNILGPMTSLYWWDGAVQQGDEVVLIAKTTVAQVPAVTEKVKALHSDDCPCVVALPVDGALGNADFLQWIRTEAGRG